MKNPATRMRRNGTVRCAIYTRKTHTHTVLVREGGFEYEGQRYRSLTVIAEQITGAHWSGPRFFGVTQASARFPT